MKKLCDSLTETADNLFLYLEEHPVLIRDPLGDKIRRTVLSLDELAVQIAGLRGGRRPVRVFPKPITLAVKQPPASRF